MRDLEEEEEEVQVVKKKKSKKKVNELFDEMDNQIRAVSGGKPVKLDPATAKRHEKMKATFDKIEDQNRRTEEMRRKKEKMLAEQAAFVPPPMPKGYPKPS